MSRRQRALLIALTWTCAAVLAVLPLVWPAYAHVAGSHTGQYYGTLTLGVVIGWMTRDLIASGRRR